ncbi:MAG: hypothetical protein WBP79_13295 [Candidatus Acidiferrales bacterium]
MLRVDIRDSTNALSLKLEGRFTGHDAENTRTLMARCHDGMTLVVDLTEVTFIDSVGEEVLSFFGRFGAEFAASTSYALDVCERLHLRLARDGASDTNTSGASRTNGRRRRTLSRQPENEEV